MTATYDFARIEPKWQQYWFNHKTFAAADPGTSGTDKPKYYVLDMFPYPSGAGLHVGHPEGYTATDIIARYKRALGFNVLHPIGWDAFGLPAEQYAVKTNQHPREATAANINNFRRQIQMLGFSYDWDREVDTTDPNYFRWTQWIFLQIYNSWFDHVLQKARPIAELIEELDSGKRPLSCYSMQGTFSQLDDTAKRKLVDSHRLAYQAEVPVNWCPQLGTVLANEEVIDGKSEVGGFPVERKPMRQWMLRITAYAERLLKDLEQLDWPEPIKQQQRNWIGRSEGSEVRFALADDPDQSIVVFTTRPDTLFGATYMVLAPEHALVGQITTPQQRGAVEQYCKQAAAKSDLDRTDLAKEKTGVFTGAHVINPANQEHIQIWIADYVLISYGTGAIMAVPAHDQRDFEFASKFRLAIRQVVQPPPDAKGETDKAFVGDGVAINSGSYDGLTTAQFKKKIVEVLAKAREGKAAINYKLRDWLFSRQRYWGEPFPLLHDDQGNVIALEDDDLPVTLPPLNDFRPTGDGEPPLARAKDWLQVSRNGQTFSRETNTMPQWAGSCWYYLRYIDAKNDQKMIDPQKEQYWMRSTKPDGTTHIGGVDLYIGGVEHAVLHLLYARFWHKVLYDLGYVSTPEPFGRLFNQGLILGEDNQKMSKSRGNVINPDDVVKQYGADSLRLYEMFMGPLEQVKPWSMHGVEGVYRFCQRVWRLIVDEENDAIQPRIGDSDNEELERALHKTIKKVGGDIDRFAFNTAVSAMMEFINEAYRSNSIGKSQAQRFLVILAPFAPHLCEELWQRLGHDETLAYEPWPKFDEALTVDEEVEIAIQITGKVRGKITVASDADETAIREAALAEPRVAELLKGKSIKKVIVVKGRLVNIVAG